MYTQKQMVKSIFDWIIEIIDDYEERIENFPFYEAGLFSKTIDEVHPGKIYWKKLMIAKNESEKDIPLSMKSSRWRSKSLRLPVRRE